MSPQIPGRQAERRGLRLWNVGVVLLLAFTGAVLIAGFVFYTGWDLLGARELKKQPKIDSKTLFDLVKLSFGVVAGAGALVALVVAYRRQRVDEDAALRDTTRLHNERFTNAVSQLGNESPTVRLGGVHALAGLADDAPNRQLRQTCINVLCAFLRLPYTAESDLPAGDSAARHSYLALREARHTVIRLIRDHLRLPQAHPHSWQGHDFDFTNTVFDGGDLSKVTISGGVVNFSGATFSGRTVKFYGATFSGGVVDFSGATFSGRTVNFAGATFSGGVVDFYGATFSGRTVNFREATFSHGRVNFYGATFSHGDISFGSSTFSGGAVNFTASTFSGGNVRFHGTTFSGGNVHFEGAAFSSGEVDFSSSAFSGGEVDFYAAELAGGAVSFTGSAFSGEVVDFSDLTFSSGSLNFSEATGDAPVGLQAALGYPLPVGVTLAAGW